MCVLIIYMDKGGSMYMSLKTGLLLTTFFTSFVPSAVFAWSENLPANSKTPTTCKLEPESQCTQGIFIDLKAPGLDMNHASMPQIRLDRAKLSRANFSYATLDLANLESADLSLSNLEGAHMHAVNLQNANLLLANMKGVSLLDADLRGANLQGANLTGSTLIKAKFGGATWVDGRICAPESIGECI